MKGSAEQGARANALTRVAHLKRWAKMMKQRTVTLLACGAFTLLIGYIVLPLAFRKWMMPATLEYEGYLASASHAERPSGFPPIQLWYEASPEYRSARRVKKAARLQLVHGEAFADNVLIRRERIREYLDARVQSGEIDYVIVFPEKNGKWGDIFPILDECRKSRVRIVLLNQYEA